LHARLSGASGARHSLRPLFGEGGKFKHNPGVSRRGIAESRCEMQSVNEAMPCPTRKKSSAPSSPPISLMTARPSRTRYQRISASPAPYDNAIDKPTYFERCWRNSGWIERHELERIFVEGDEAFVTYRCVARGGKSFRNTEFFTFERDKVKRIDVYFGATYQDGAFVRQRP
jgi:hypothetical protein